MKSDMFDELIESVREGMAIINGEMPPSRSFHFAPNDVQDIRSRYGFSQKEFATMIGISIKTLQNWEQGRRTPTGSAKILLNIAKKNPEVLLNATKK